MLYGQAPDVKEVAYRGNDIVLRHISNQLHENIVALGRKADIL